jgi:hypothetical protein
MSYEKYSPKRDLFFEVEEVPPIQRDGSIRITGETAPESRRASNAVGKIIESFERNIRTKIGVGIIRDQFGERFTFTEKDVVSGEPKVGHKVSFEGHPSGYASLPVACKVIVDPQTPQQLAQPKLETPARRQLPEPEVQSLLKIPPHPEQLYESAQVQELYGRVEFWGTEMRSGSILVDDNNSYQFSERDIVRGTPEQGAWAKFRAFSELNTAGAFRSDPRYESGKFESMPDRPDGTRCKSWAPKAN